MYGSDSVINSGSKATIIGCNLTDITNQLTNSSVASSISLYVDGIFGKLLRRKVPRLAIYYRVTAGLQETFQASDGRVVCGETPQLPNGAHTINATVVTTNPYLYCIDYFEVATDNSSSSSSGAPGPTSSSTGNGAQGSPTSHRDVGAIAGGVVGGIIILAALIIMCCLLSRRRRNRQSQGNEQSETGLCKFHLSIFLREH